MRPVVRYWRFALFFLLYVHAVAGLVRAEEKWAKQPDGQWAVVHESARHSVGMFDEDPRVRLFGVSLLAGFPDGIAPGVSVHPGTNVVHFDLAVTGLLSIGVRAGFTLDPFDWVLAPTLTVAAGYGSWANLPSTSVQYELYYVNIQPGLELGRRSRYRVFLRAGYSHFWAAGRNASTSQDLQATSSPSVRISAWPTVNLGVTAFFGE